MTSNRILKGVDRLVGLAGRTASLVLSRPAAVPPAQPRAILVSKLCCLGDSVLALYALRNLRARFPEAPITVITSRRVQAVYERHSFIHEVWTLPLTGTGPLRDLAALPAVWRQLVRMRKKSFDLYLDLDLYSRFTSWIPLLLRISFSAGLRVPGKPDWYQYSIDRGRDQPEAEVFQGLLAHFGAGRDFSPYPWALNRAEEEYADASFRGAGPAPAGGWAALFPGSSPNWPQKQWPVHNFRELSRMLWDRHQMGTVWIGSAADRAGLDALSPSASSVPSLDLMGKTTFHQLAAVVRRCRLVVGNDSGPLHLADSLGRPVFTIFGPTNPRKWAPLHQPGHAIHRGLPCSPCYHLSYMPACPYKYRCLAGLGAEEVFAAVNNFLTTGK
jgi:ADP-heptose:LPS heptosyltransferase